MGFAAPIAGIASLAGAGIKAAGAAEAGAAQQTAYNYNAAVAQMQAQVDQQMSTREIMDIGPITQKIGFQVAQVRGLQRASYGAGNIAGATPARVEQSTTQVGQWQQQLAASNQMGKAYRLQVEAASQIAQSNLDKFMGQQASIAGDIGAAGSILGGVGSVGSKAMQFGQSFGGGSSFFNALS